MTWTLTATGNCASDEDERALVQDLNWALSNPKASCSASGFVGEAHRGPAHGLPEEKPDAKKTAAKPKASD